MKPLHVANLKTIALTAVVTGLLVLAYMPAHASTARGEAGHHGASLGSTAHTSSAVAATGAQAAQGGGRYSMVDNYQPWPESEMAQYAKPHFVPFDGK